MDNKELLRVALEALKASKNAYSVYVLVNHTKKAIYFGVARDPQTRLIQHGDNQVQATKYWAFEKDEIVHKVLETGLSQEKASETAHAYEKMTFDGFEEYKVIQTSGI
ncbi:MAG: GIY-YIG nuclease family protein [Verrucomicrobiota bacterium]|nr:GIY-YIG nuclease family protein [Verrucomicrobiota bacterium]